MLKSYKWLVWGHIPFEYIITTFSARSIRSYLNAAPRLQDVLRLNEIETCIKTKACVRMLEKKPIPVCRDHGATSSSHLQTPFPNQANEFQLVSVHIPPNNCQISDKTSGHFLAFIGVPEGSTLHTVASKLARAWKFTGAGSKQRMTSFLSGVDVCIERWD